MAWNDRGVLGCRLSSLAALLLATGAAVGGADAGAGAQQAEPVALAAEAAGETELQTSRADDSPINDSRMNRAIEISVGETRQTYITSLGRVSDEPFADIALPAQPQTAGGGRASRGGECQLINAYASQEFSGGTYFVQAGFVESEIAAATYTLDPGLFPIRIDLIEALIGTAGTSVQTTTAYTIFVWDGAPDTGQLIASFSSDGAVLPDITIPPGAPQAVNVNFLIDPGDPEQIFITNASGQNSYSIGIRIDEHNSQTGNGCFPAPPQNANAFPMTDTDGADQNGNLINAFNCGAFGCPPGWSTFAQFPTLCTPNGDWMLRATWTSFSCSAQTGACCDGDGNCFDLTAGECDSINGSYQGVGTACSGFTCPVPEGACCLDNGNCLSLSAADCALLSGEWQGGNTECNGSLCPIGAACLPDGSCVDGITQLEADMLGGTFLGVGTVCQGTNCPQPRGACCIRTTLNCLQLTADECALIADAVWQGIDSVCDTDGDGQPDGMCLDPGPDCAADTNGDGDVTPADFNAWISAFNAQSPACDQNGDNQCTPADFNAWISNFNAGCG